MNAKKKVLAILGSTRAASSNLNLVKAIQELTKDVFDITIYDGIGQLPQFNPDMGSAESMPSIVANFRSQITEADGVLISTPEYAMGVPGALKNAIDWTVSSCEFSHKPVALITASTSGLKAHDSLLATLQVIEAKMTEETALVIQFIKTKVNNEYVITDANTLQQVHALLNALEQMME
jgi:chromate reductase, NAD(P)H dehydrogenase (quinone)